MPTPQNFSAKEPSLGYYYQMIYGLKMMLAIKDENYGLRLENLDDIELICDEHTILYQTKYHVAGANLTDMNPDFWKTIRVWATAISTGQIDIDKTILNLITTSAISTESVLSKLKYDQTTRNSDEIISGLIDITTKSKNKELEPAFAAFIDLDAEQQKKLVEKINIIDSSCSIDNAQEEIRRSLSVATTYKNTESFTEKLQGWWVNRCVELLQNKRDKILYSDLHLQIDSLRDEYTVDNLPDDFLSIVIPEEDIAGQQNKVFVKQLELITQQSLVVKKAIQDFIKAYKQRSEWIRKDLLNIQELDTFDNKLFDYWENIFVAMKDDCQGIDEAKLQELGASFYRTFLVYNTPPIKIRERFTSSYLTRGSCHILADDKKIGWHPNFDELLNDD